jgi:glycosyltransferase involved in cell wall biosynthesis
MIKIAIVLPDSTGSWMGGINYFSNLFSAVSLLQNPKIKIFLVTPRGAPEALLKKFRNHSILKTSIVSSKNIFWRILRKFSDIFFGIDIPLYLLLKRYGIQVLSHSGSLGRNSKLISIGWIADFQHIETPQFFSEREVSIRNLTFSKMFRECSRIILSSHSAIKFLDNFPGSNIQRVAVMPFYVGLNTKDSTNFSDSDLFARYKLTPKSYFHLPNQFWRHKNHKLVIDALEILNNRGKFITIICTGDTRDYRSPGYFELLMKYARQKNVVNNFRVLGIVPYEDMLGIMRSSIAVINPSLSEGWSTSVEEARSLGLPTILSNIDVHKEQNPFMSTFFDPNSPENLATQLLRFTDGVDLSGKLSKINPIQYIDSSNKQIELAEAYQTIVLSVFFAK